MQTQMPGMRRIPPVQAVAWKPRAVFGGDFNAGDISAAMHAQLQNFATKQKLLGWIDLISLPVDYYLRETSLCWR